MSVTATTSSSDLGGFRFGIEAEYLLLPTSGEAPETSRHDHDSWDDTGLHQRIVDQLPDLADPDLTQGDLAIKRTRWAAMDAASLHHPRIAIAHPAYPFGFLAPASR